MKKYEKPISRDLNTFSIASGACSSGLFVGNCDPNGLNAGTCVTVGNLAGSCSPGSTVVTDCANGTMGHASQCVKGDVAVPG
jgi:hypothetical protein